MAVILKKDRKFKVTHKLTEKSIIIRYNSNIALDIIELAKDELYLRYEIDDEENSNYKIEQIEIKTIDIPEPIKVGNLLTKSSIQLPMDVLIKLSSGSKAQSPAIKQEEVKSKPIPLSIKKGDKVKLKDGREGYIVKYSSNNDIKLWFGELNQEQYNKNIHPFDTQVTKDNISNKINL